MLVHLCILKLYPTLVYLLTYKSYIRCSLCASRCCYYLWIDRIIGCDVLGRWVFPRCTAAFLVTRIRLKPFYLFRATHFLQKCYLICLRLFGPVEYVKWSLVCLDLPSLIQSTLLSIVLSVFSILVGQFASMAQDLLELVRWASFY